MKERCITVVFAVLLCVFFLASSLQAAPSGCITCHTDGAVLKSLHKPVKIEGDEGEG
jgi:hypothetical protein